MNAPQQVPASEADAASQALLEGLLLFMNAAPVGLVQASPDGAIELMNGMAAQLLMPLVPGGLCSNVFTVLQPVAAGLREQVAAFAGDNGLVCEGLRLRLPHRGRSGEALQVLSLNLVKAGRLGVMAMLTDITRQVLTEEALGASQAQLAFTLDAVQVGDWSLDLGSGLVTRSLRHDRCFGFATAQPSWHIEDFFGCVHPQDRDAVLHSFRVSVAERSDWRVECRITWPDSSQHWVLMHGHVQQAEGWPVRMVGVVLDTTVQRQAEVARLQAAQLAAENRQIQETSRMKSQFLANMSHELRTPLNAVIGFADLLGSGVVQPGTPQHARYLGHIATSGRHLLQLINDVLDLSKVESGKFEFFPEPVQLPRLVAEVIDTLHTAIQQKNLAVTTALDPALTDLVLDPARLKQVLYNLLSNAIKFTPAGGQVTVRAVPFGVAQFRVEVEDNGIGIAAEDLPRLFIEFQQLDAGLDKRHEGTGLGLALSRKLVEAQGGTVGVRSTPGVGTVFHLVMARVRPAPPAGSATLSTRLPTPAAQGAAAPTDWVDEPAATVLPMGVPGSSGRLLVIEDSHQAQGRLVQALSAAGFRVDTAATGLEALQRARSTPYDAITLDLMLPDRRGLDLLGAIRQQGASRGAQVVGVSMPALAPAATEAGAAAAAEPADPTAAAAFAIANVLSKPLRSEEVVAAMARLRPRGGDEAARPLRVMVVDDDPLARDLMRATLTALAIDVVTLPDGDTALATIAEHRPDALILDLMLPGSTGFEVLDRLRRMPAWYDLPVFIWTTLLLTDDEYVRLSRSAQAMLRQGGGQLAAMLDDLQRWRSQVAAAPNPVA